MTSGMIGGIGLLAIVAGAFIAIMLIARRGREKYGELKREGADDSKKEKDKDKKDPLVEEARRKNNVARERAVIAGTFFLAVVALRHVFAWNTWPEVAAFLFLLYMVIYNNKNTNKWLQVLIYVAIVIMISAGAFILRNAGVLRKVPSGVEAGLDRLDQLHLDTDTMYESVGDALMIKARESYRRGDGKACYDDVFWIYDALYRAMGDPNVVLIQGRGFGDPTTKNGAKNWCLKLLMVGNEYGQKGPDTDLLGKKDPRYVPFMYNMKYHYGSLVAQYSPIARPELRLPEMVADPVGYDPTVARNEGIKLVAPPEEGEAFFPPDDPYKNWGEIIALMPWWPFLIPSH